MSFAEHLSNYNAAQIVAATGCPRATAYDWLSARREPPEWQQHHWLSIIQQYKGNTPLKTKKPLKNLAP